LTRHTNSANIEFTLGLIMALMTSRDRVLAALEHREPDRVPIDLGGNQSGIHVKAYMRLLSYLDIQDEIVIADFNQQLARVCDAVLDRFHVDTRFLRSLSSYQPYDQQKVQYEGEWVGNYDNFGVFWGDHASKDLSDILFYDPVIHPLADAQTVQDVETFAWPDGTDPTPFKGLRDVARDLHEAGKAVVTTKVGNTFELCTFLFGFQRTMRLVRTGPNLLDAAMRKLVEYWKNCHVALIAEAGEYLDVVCINGDLAQQSGPLINPAFYEKHVKPFDKEIVDHVKSLAPVKANYHSCGSVPPFVPHFIDLGYDSMNPVQVSAFDMEPASLKVRFGDRIAFWGGLCNSQSTLPFGTPEAVREEVARNVSALKPGAGYIAANIHNITAEVPAENIVAMFDAAYEFGAY
jgi:uroporphyrinogen decarboxylase